MSRKGTVPHPRPATGSVVEVAPMFEVDGPGGFASARGKSYVLDYKANTLKVFDQRQPVRTIGSVGSGRGELLRPGRLAVLPDGTVYVADFGNQRIEIFDPRDRYAGEVKLPDFIWDFTAGPHGEILLSHPEDGALVSVYDHAGKLVRRVGALRKTSEIYGAAMRRDDERNRLLINRVKICTSGRGEIYTSFSFAPLVQKYDPAGKLLWETRLAGPAVDEVTRLFTADEQRIGKKYISLIVDGRAANPVASGCAFDGTSQRLFVLLPNRHLVVLDTAGRVVATLPVQAAAGSSGGRQVACDSVASRGDGGIVILDPFAGLLWGGTVPSSFR